MTTSLLLFSVLAVGSISTALLMITRRNPVMSVLYLIANFFFLAILYLMLDAQFIAIIQILVYAGAIMVLFLFVIMLLNLGNEDQLEDKMNRKKLAAVVLSLAMLLQLGVPFLVGGQTPHTPSPRSADIGTVESMGRSMFTQYVLPFEAVSFLLLAAIVGAVVLAKKKLR